MVDRNILLLEVEEQFAYHYQAMQEEKRLLLGTVEENSLDKVF